VLHLIQEGKGGLQITSLIFGAFGGCKLTLNFLRITKFEMLADATTFDKFPDKQVLAMTLDKELLQGTVFLENLP
jgi:hypothetical protein